jgi:hypothetical protein
MSEQGVAVDFQYGADVDYGYGVRCVIKMNMCVGM